MKHPPYAFVPGHWPHPTRDPDGHSYGVEEPNLQPMQHDAWDSSATYLAGIELFNHGYYWEAHEKWEGLWHAAGREGAMNEFFRGLIKLAAAGVKVRQGLPRAVVSFGHAAAKHFGEAQRQSQLETIGGLELCGLVEFAGHVAEQGPALKGNASRAVEVVFQQRLSPQR